MTVVANKRSLMSLYSEPTDLQSHCVRIVIAEKALVTAEIEAHCLYIEGHFRGIARVSFLYLSKLGQCEGNIKTQCIFVEEGARMQSKVTIEKKDNPPQSESVISSENQ